MPWRQTTNWKSKPVWFILKWINTKYEILPLNWRELSGNIPVSAFYVEPCCRVRIQTAGSQNRDHRHSLQTEVSAWVYGPACDTPTASAPPEVGKEYQGRSDTITDTTHMSCTVRDYNQTAVPLSTNLSSISSTFSFTLARAISSFHLCCSASSRDLLRLEMVCWSSLFSLLILSTSAGVNFWFCSWCWRSSRSCFRTSRWLTKKEK